jgi:hypothetical protein
MVPDWAGCCFLKSGRWRFGNRNPTPQPCWSRDSTEDASQLLLDQRGKVIIGEVVSSFAESLDTRPTSLARTTPLVACVETAELFDRGSQAQTDLLAGFDADYVAALEQWHGTNLPVQ